MRKRNTILKKEKLIVIFILSVMVLLGTWYVYSVTSKKENAHNPVALSVKKIIEESQGDIPQLTGEVIPNTMSKINADNTKGIISKVYIKVGDKVKKGEKLFTYKNSENTLALKELETEIAKLQNKMQLTTQTLGNKITQLEVKKQEKNDLNTKLNNSNESQIEDLNQKIKMVDEEIQTIETEIGTLKNEQSDEQLDLDKAQTAQIILKEKQIEEEVVSPVEGIVKKIDEEQMNTAGNNGAQSGSFMEIMDTSSLKVQGKVDELKKDKLRIGQTVIIIDRKNQEKKWKGKISRLDDLAVEEEGESHLSKYHFEITVEEVKDKPTIGGHVYIQPQIPPQNKIIVPSSFIVKEGGKSYIWKVKDGKATKQNITLGKVDKGAGKTEIKNGITLQDQILMPTSALREGIEVKHD